MKFVRTMIAINLLFLVLYFVADWQIWVQFTGGLNGFRGDVVYEGLGIIQRYEVLSRTLAISGTYRTASSFEGFTLAGFSWNFPQILFAMLVALNVFLCVLEGRTCQKKDST